MHWQASWSLSTCHYPTYHGHSVLGHCVCDIIFEPHRLHAQRWGNIQDVRVLLTGPQVWGSQFRSATSRQNNILEAQNQLFKTAYTRNVPLVLIWCMRSNLFMGVASVPVKWMALALLMTMSMPPNCFTACSMELWTLDSSRTSTMLGRACPPADSTAQSNADTYTAQLKCF